MNHSALIFILGIAVMLAGCQGNKDTLQNADVPDVQAANANQEAVNAVEIIDSVDTDKVGKETDEQRTAYLAAKTGVGFNFLNPQQLTEDLKRADELGLVILNAPYEKNSEIPEIIRVGFELGLTKLPVPNMAGSAKDPEGLEQAYLKLVEDYDPVYVGLGNEIERMKDKEQFVQIYNGIYGAIKNKCPDCIVYPVFQYEQFDPSLTEQMKLDLLAFTSYPFAKYSDIRAIPDDYYKPALDVAAKLHVQIAFTELGWTHLKEYRSGYSSTDEVQAAFIRRFYELIDDSETELAFASWGLLHGAPQIGEEWAEMGLYDQQGKVKLLLRDALLRD